MDKKVINNIRSLSIDMINEAGSGHPGICLGASPILYTLFLRHLNLNKEDGLWLNRDRFILSAGHGSAMLYSTLFLAGYPIQIEDLKKFRQINSITPGHPELNPEIGVEITSGLLGEGFATSVGFAIAEEHLGSLLGKDLINHYTYVLVSDGDLMEGISYEAASLAGSLKLGKLIVLYDSNDISMDGNMENYFNEDVLKRFEACGWHTEYVEDAEDIMSIDKAINNAKSITNKPSIIKVKSKIGQYSSLEGTKEIHSKKLTDEEVLNIKKNMKVNEVPFHISKDSTIYFREKIEERITPIYNEWVQKYNETYSSDYKKKTILELLEKNNFHIDLSKMQIHLEEGQSEELRESNGKLMNLLNEIIPLYMSLSADLFSSTKTFIEKGGVFSSEDRKGKNVYLGVRENLMASVLNGLSLNGIKGIGSTFLTFSDFMKPGMRLSSIMNLPVTYIFTHDSVRMGEDGITHQPIEQIGMLRSIPGMIVLRPTDIKELVGSWNYIINNKMPVSLVISKSKVTNLKNSKILGIEKGAYIIEKEKGRLSGIIISSGEDLHVALKISEELEKKGIFLRIVSMPSIDLFKMQDNEYKNKIIEMGTKVIAIESSNDSAWKEFVYNEKYLLNIKSYGYSGASDDVLEKLNFDYSSLLNQVENLIK